MVLQIFSHWQIAKSYTVEKFCHRNSGTRQTKSGKLPARGWKLLERKNNQRFCLGFWGEKVGLIFQAAAAVMKRENGMQQVIITLPCESLLWEQVLPGDHLPYFSSSSPPPCPAPPRLSFFSSSSEPPLSVSPAVQCACAFFSAT